MKDICSFCKVYWRDCTCPFFSPPKGKIRKWKKEDGYKKLFKSLFGDGHFRRELIPPEWLDDLCGLLLFLIFIFLPCFIIFKVLT